MLDESQKTLRQKDSPLLGTANSHSEPMQRGVASIKRGRYGDALSAFEEACLKYPDSDEPKVMLNDVIRAIDINRHLIASCFQSMGISLASYRGFSLTQENLPSREKLQVRREQLAMGDTPWAHDFRIQLEADRLATTGEVVESTLQVDHWTGDPTDKARAFAVLGEQYFRHGHFRMAQKTLNKSTDAQIAARVPYEIMGYLQLNYGHRINSMYYFDISIMIVDDYWFSFGKIWHPNDYERSRAILIDQYIQWKNGYAKFWADVAGRLVNTRPEPENGTERDL